MSWLAPAELRVGLGCMRLSTDAGRDEDRAAATLAAALESGITVFDTARSYGHGEDDLGHNERLLAAVLHRPGPHGRARVVTKAGISRAGGGWIPDGRARTVQRDCEASLVALDGLPIDLLLLHAPDPRTPWRTSVRALGRLVEAGLVRRVGVANVNRSQLEEALSLAPLAAVEVSLSLLDGTAVRGGLLARCEQAGLTVIAHSPLGGPRRVRSLLRRPELATVAHGHGVGPAEVALAWLVGLSPSIVAIPGARRPETARNAALAGALRLAPDEQETLARAFDHERPVSRPRHRATAIRIVLVMGIPGSGKTRLAADYVARSYVRLNRDERGGGLRDVAAALEDALTLSPPGIVLDNTYLTRASRSYVIDAARRHGATVRCIWLDTSLAQAQTNLVERLLKLFGTLPSPEDLRRLARSTAGVMAPTSQMRAVRELEPPATEEGFDHVERVPFLRAPAPERRTDGAVFVAASALTGEGCRDAVAEASPGGGHLVFDWRPGQTATALEPAVADLATAVGGPVAAAVCPHPAGPPICWCRPPLPGLPLAFAHAHDVDPRRSVLIGTSAAHRALAAAIGARYVSVQAG